MVHLHDFGKMTQVTLSGIPTIRMETNDITFRYRGEASADTLLGRLGEKIAQRRLSGNDREAIKR